MSSIAIELFVEDRAHEAFLTPLLVRLATEEGLNVRIRARSSRGGHARALEEFSTYQKVRLGGLGGCSLPELVVVGIDANCDSFVAARKQIEARIGSDFAHRYVVACPDPHIEAWFLADLSGFANLVGVRPNISLGKCERDYYKQALAQAIVDAGHPNTLGGIEFAKELVGQMDLFHAGKASASLKHCIEDLRGYLKRLAQQEEPE